MIQRERKIDIIKAIAIVLMVYGHTFPFCRSFIYLFHMPIFCMVSGYCYKPEINSKKELLSYIFRKIKKLYIPYIICNLVYLFFTNMFINWGIYTNDSIFRELTGETPYYQNLYYYMSFYSMIRRIPNILVLRWQPPINVASWFLPELLLIVIVHSTLTLYLKKKKSIWYILVAVIYLVALFISHYRPKFYIAIIQFFSMYFAFLIGIGLKKMKLKDIYSKRMGIISFILLAVLSFFQKVELAQGVIDGLWYPVSCVCGWIMLMVIAEEINRFDKLSNCLCFIGCRTIPIIFLHLLSFKIVTMLYICIRKENMVLLASFPVLFNTGEYIKIIYTIIGVAIPLIIYSCYDKMRKCSIYYLKK